MARLFAHLGAQKTGSTAFQHWLQLHRDDLGRAGVFVPRKRTGNHGGIVRALHTPELPQHRVEQLLARLRRDPSSDLLLSAEYMSTMTDRALAAALERLAEPSRERVAILVVRDPIDHFNSGYAHRRKAMRNTSPDFGTFVDEALAAQRADWRSKVELFQAFGFTVRVLAYDRALIDRGVTRSILMLPEFGDLASRFDWSADVRANDSAGAIGAIIMDLILATLEGEPSAEGTRSSPELRARVIEVARSRCEDMPFNGFTADQRTRVLDHYRESNNWIADRFFDAAWDETLPPAPERPPSPERLEDLDPFRAAAVRATANEIAEEARRSGWL